ncbi:hypothetical protein I4U23_009640 [Adineta vaga]|nr:hypothetical protein I4U23_009640 [Adineta vaga]
MIVLGNYELKMENCTDEALRDYYISSCNKLREQEKLLLEIYKEKLIDSKSVEEMKYLSSKVDYLLRQNNDHLKSQLDCWDTSSTRKKEEQNDFKDKLILYYQCGSSNMKKIKCMILNKYFDRNRVRASHIWKSSTKGVGLTKFHLQECDVDNEQNGLLLYDSIEKAFDYKKIMLLI